MHRCGLLLQLSHGGLSVCVSVCVLVTQVCCVRSSELIELPLGVDSF